MKDFSFSFLFRQKIATKADDSFTNDIQIVRVKRETIQKNIEKQNMNVLCNLSPEGFINIFLSLFGFILFISMIFDRIQTIYVFYYMKVNQHCWPQVKASFYGIPQ